MADPSITLDRNFAAAPSTTRGQAVQLSADPKGQRIAYASGKSIFVRSIDSPAESAEYTGHVAVTTVARFSPNGVKIASGDANGLVHIWEPDNIDRKLGEFTILAGRLNDVAWDGDSQRVVAVGNGKTTFGRCITADSGNSVGEISGHSKSVNAVAMKLQRPFRAATVGDDGNMVFYHGAPYKMNGKSNLHKGLVLGAAYSPDGSRLATVGGDKIIRLYDGTTGQHERDVGEGEHKGSIYALSWSHDGNKFATASADRTVRLWDAQAGAVIQSWEFGDGVSVRDQQLGVVIPHGRSDGLIISINLAGELIYMREGQKEPVRILQGHARSITALADSSVRQGSCLWTGSFEGRVCHWDVEAGAARMVDGEPHKNQVVQITSLDGRVFTTSWDDTVKTADESAAAFVGGSIQLPAQPKGISASNGTVFVATVSSIAAYADGKLLRDTKLDYAPTCIAARGPFVAVGADGSSVKVYKAAPNGVLDEVKTLTAASGTTSALAFSRDASHLAAGNSVGKIYAYDTATWQVVADRWTAHTGRVTCIAWDEAGAHVASGSLDTHIYVWCLDKKLQGKRIQAASAHKEGVNGITWLRNDRIASAGTDATVKIWNVKHLP
ncbi:uncharacterized protein UV8b_07333 [Ustilaginoidea virens]|uniref:Uncharacterized protein n=1 Tax=Ustilaginoidea virens TaxID=1159556 RepID=A0A063BID6_USTVR|nr:uncharacterized protein UV8b_07333 [Ustilaginoidea virens]QUC23092.1 hypothetical protein UV8b_07333 [Ustilaginoidea virens]GAO18082.1 hypothetical protein UVI_02059840 [Ustilaginoidea virens]